MLEEGGNRRMWYCCLFASQAVAREAHGTSSARKKRTGGEGAQEAGGDCDTSIWLCQDPRQLNAQLNSTGYESCAAAEEEEPEAPYRVHSERTKQARTTPSSEETDDGERIVLIEWSIPYVLAANEPADYPPPCVSRDTHPVLALDQLGLLVELRRSENRGEASLETNEELRRLVQDQQLRHQSTRRPESTLRPPPVAASSSSPKNVTRYTLLMIVGELPTREVANEFARSWSGAAHTDALSRGRKGVSLAQERSLNVWADAESFPKRNSADEQDARERGMSEPVSA